jgi:NadR type nicotinamide-nucleotide adenylyltransferase
MVDQSSSRTAVGVVVGKFNPPHLGHLHLIRTAASMVARLYVLLCDRPDQTLSVEQRFSWLSDAAPDNVTIIVTPDDLTAANEPWAQRALSVLPEPPDLAFTSESWGREWAQLMGARHHLVDIDRKTFPASGTALRADLASNFGWLVPAARAELARRVVVVGAESTGKSTMAEALAESTGSVWIPEHGRWYWQGRRYRPDQTWDSDEFLRIARAQHRLEEDLARQSTNGLVIADTDALVTAVWHERYLGSSDPKLEGLVASNVPSLYLVCADDFDWVQDGTRESHDHRSAMQRSIEQRTRTSGAPVVTLNGSHEQRLARALEALQPLRKFPALI